MWLFDHGRIFYFAIYNLSMLRQAQRFPRATTQNHSSNFPTLVLRLKSKIQELQAMIARQQSVIDGFKHQYRNTKINQMQVEIQHLHQENKRLRQMAQSSKQRRKEPLLAAKKMTVNSCAKLTEKKTVTCQYRVEPKLYEVLKENEALRKQLINLKINESVLKKRNSTLNDRSSIILEKSLIEHDHLLQEKIDLQAERDLLSKKVRQLQSKLAGLATRNNELQTIHYKHIPISMILADF